MPRPPRARVASTDTIRLRVTPAEHAELVARARTLGFRTVAELLRYGLWLVDWSPAKDAEEYRNTLNQ